MAENYDLIFGQSASSQYAWSDGDYQNGWQTVGSTPPTAEQFDALQRKSDTKAKDLNDRLSPLEEKAEADGRQAATTYTAGAMLTVDGLPNGWLLECIAPGISGTEAITLPDTLIDGLTIIDGNVTWALRKVATNGDIGYRQPSTAYAVGNIAYHASLPTGYYLECTTQGTTGSGDLSISSTTIGATVTDGTVTWTICKEIGTGNVPLVAGYNQKQTFTSSGTFTPTTTGLYKITLQGAGGGGGGAGDYGSGSGGSGGATLHFYEKLTAGTSYSFVIGAGGAGGAVSADGSEGGASSITVNNNEYVASGGAHGRRMTQYEYIMQVPGGNGTINGVYVTRGLAGGSGFYNTSASMYTFGGSGGGFGGGNTQLGADATAGINGGGGGGGAKVASTNRAGGAGGDGYITFEWLDTSLL